MSKQPNPAGPLPALIAFVTAVCGIIGVSLETSAQVQTATASGAALVLAVWQWQHHRTVRNFDRQSAAVRVARDNAAASHAALERANQLTAAAQANHGAGWPTAHADARPQTAVEWEHAAAAVRAARGNGSGSVIGAPSGSVPGVWPGRR